MRTAAGIALVCALALAGCSGAQRTSTTAAAPPRVARTGEPIQPVLAVVASNPAQAELGKQLFFEPRLSRSGFLSCNSCHNLATGGVDGLPSPIGHRWKLGPINSPTVLNARYNVAQFWNGRARDLADQAGGPIANPGEMASSHDAAAVVLQSMPGYVTAFKAVYGTDRITIDQVRQAIAAFESTLVTPDSRFDRWLYGDASALGADEQAGYALFKGKGCVACHNGPAVGGGSYQKFGVHRAFATTNPAQGRVEVTKDPADRMVFKVPVLRNVELTAPYFHDGSRWSLGEAVDVMADVQLGVTLTRAENAKLVSFLRTLTGKAPEIRLPTLPPSTPGTPKPDRG